jgi:hypothetical protein
VSAWPDDIIARCVSRDDIARPHVFFKRRLTGRITGTSYQLTVIYHRAHSELGGQLNLRHYLPTGRGNPWLLLSSYELTVSCFSTVDVGGTYQSCLAAGIARHWATLGTAFNRLRRACPMMLNADVLQKRGQRLHRHSDDGEAENE